MLNNPQYLQELEAKFTLYRLIYIDFQIPQKNLLRRIIWNGNQKGEASHKFIMRDWDAKEIKNGGYYYKKFEKYLKKNDN